MRLGRFVIMVANKPNKAYKKYVKPSIAKKFALKRFGSLLKCSFSVISRLQHILATKDIGIYIKNGVKMTDKILKGYITNNRYIWNANEGACKKFVGRAQRFH